MRTLPALRRILAPLVLACGLLLSQVLPAAACGSLVAPNGTVRLARAATLVAWHDGVEHYMTSFEYQGDVSNLGWIVPLPAVPDKIEEGGKWTLQRLSLETHPVFAEDAGGRVAAAASGAQVLQQVTVDALDVTVLKGSGQAVLDWCAHNGFSVEGDTRSHLLTYAKGSPIFLAAKFDVSAAKARGELQGDGTPLLLTLHVAHPWVPLEVLALDGQQVHADIYLLTDQPVSTSAVGVTLGKSPVGSQVSGAPGFTVNYQQPVSARLYTDLSTDRNMGWVWPNSWLTYLSLDAPDTSVTYDLGVTTAGVLRVAPFGTAPMAVSDPGAARTLPVHLPMGTADTLIAVLIWLLVLGAAAAIIVVPIVLDRRARRAPRV